MRCYFEKTAEAATFSEVDKLKGVTENILLRQIAPLETGHFDLFLNEKMLKDAIERTSEVMISEYSYTETPSRPSMTSRWGVSMKVL